MHWEKEFEHAGYRCLVGMNTLDAHRCGYVDVPAGHPAHGMGFRSLDDALSVHGGVTYAEEVDGCWRVGFDCGHISDAPDMDWARKNPELFEGNLEWLQLTTDRHIEYSYVPVRVWTEEEVEGEVGKLAVQLKNMEARDGD